MWHILEKCNRRVGRKVTSDYANYLYEKVGGRLDPSHKPSYWGELSVDDFPEGVVGYVSNARPMYDSGQIIVEADGVYICTVTRKDDAFRIMQALKRDYKNIIVRLKLD